ncbi:metal ABC transporter permease [Aerococcaceae bacterium WGS1372]
MLQILYILIVVGISCSLVGALLLLKENLMVADAISHTILLGIVVAYYFTNDLSSPYLIVGATIFGVITVISIELLERTGRVQSDSAIGLVFPLFFSLAVIIISKYYTNVHLDIDMVLLGQVELAPLKQIEVLAIHMPQALFIGLLILMINIIFILITYVALKVRLFDETFARSIGIRVALLDFVLMTLVSLTAVASFESVGSILVIALMAIPSMTARCLTKKFSTLLIGSAIVAVVNSIIGFYVAIYFNTSISSMVAVSGFVIFIVVFTITNVLIPSMTHNKVTNS